jgi:hypothetical protein
LEGKSSEVLSKIKLIVVNFSEDSNIDWDMEFSKLGDA